MDLSSRCLHAPPGAPAKPEIVRRTAMTGCLAAGVAAASNRGILHRGAEGNAYDPYTDRRYPLLEIPDMSNGEQSPSGIREPRTSEHGDGGARSCVAQTASSSCSTCCAARKAITAVQLAEALEVAPRTIYRNIPALMAMRVPIDGAAGVGYIMRPGYDLPPLMFDREEVEAVTVELQVLNRTGDQDLQAAADGWSRTLHDGPVIKAVAAGIKVWRVPAWPWRQSEGLPAHSGESNQRCSSQRAGARMRCTGAASHDYRTHTRYTSHSRMSKMSEVESVSIGRFDVYVEPYFDLDAIGILNSSSTVRNLN